MNDPTTTHGEPGEPGLDRLEAELGPRLRATLDAKLSTHSLSNTTPGNAGPVVPLAVGAAAVRTARIWTAAAALLVIGAGGGWLAGRASAGDQQASIVPASTASTPTPSGSAHAGGSPSSTTPAVSGSRQADATSVTAVPGRGSVPCRVVGRPVVDGAAVEVCGTFADDVLSSIPVARDMPNVACVLQDPAIVVSALPGNGPWPFVVMPTVEDGMLTMAVPDGVTPAVVVDGREVQPVLDDADATDGVRGMAVRVGDAAHMVIRGLGDGVITIDPAANSIDVQAVVLPPTVAVGSQP